MTSTTSASTAKMPIMDKNRIGYVVNAKEEEKLFKRIVCFILIFTLPMCLFGCTLNMKMDKTSETVVDIGESSFFTEDDRNAAVDIIMDRIQRNLAITKLYTVKYAGDEEKEKTKYELSYATYEEVIVFYISFHTSVGAANYGLNNDMDYDGYREVFGKNADGQWELIEGACGYC